MTPLNAEHANARENAWLRWSEGLPEDVLPDARAAWEKTLESQGIDFHFALADLGRAVTSPWRTLNPQEDSHG